MPKKKQTPLIERDEKDIRREMARFLGESEEAVRVTKAQLADGRAVAYIRVVWKRGVTV